MKRFIILLLALVSVILLNVHLYFQYGFMPLLLKAETIDSYVDYAYFDVPNFDGYTPILKETTPDLELYYKIELSMSYEVSYCPLNGGIGTMGLYFEVWNEAGQYVANANLPSKVMNCLEAGEVYSFSHSINLRTLNYVNGYSFEAVKEKILLFDDQYLRFATSYLFYAYPVVYGYTMTVTNSVLKTYLEIQFNNYYLMSTFLLDSDFYYSNKAGTSRPFVLYTSTSTDTYNVYNENLTGVTTRKKYAVEIPDVDGAIVVDRIGTGFETRYNTYTITMRAGQNQTLHMWYFYLLNASPMATPFDDAVIDTTPNYASCNEGLFGWPVECTIDGQGVSSFQAMANDVWEWLSKDSPIVSDLLALASSGFQWLDNSLQFLGFFNPTTLLGAGIWVGVAVLLIAYAFNGGE